MLAQMTRLSPTSFSSVRDKQIGMGNASSALRISEEPMRLFRQLLNCECLPIGTTFLFQLQWKEDFAKTHWNSNSTFQGQEGHGCRLTWPMIRSQIQQMRQQEGYRYHNSILNPCGLQGYKYKVLNFFSPPLFWVRSTAQLCNCQSLYFLGWRKMLFPFYSSLLWGIET